MTAQSNASTHSNKRKVFGLGFKEWMFLVGLVTLFVFAALVEPMTIYAVNQMMP